MDIFHFVDFEILNYIHHSIDIESVFHWTLSLNSERTDFIRIHLLKTVAVICILEQIKTDNTPDYVYSRIFLMH